MSKLHRVLQGFFGNDCMVNVASSIAGGMSKESMKRHLETCNRHRRRVLKAGLFSEQGVFHMLDVAMFVQRVKYAIYVWYECLVSRFCGGVLIVAAED